MSVISHGLQRWVWRSSSVAVAILFLVLPNMSCTKTRYGDESFYEDVAWGIMTGLVDIYNQNIVGTPTGPVDMVAKGPFGGTVHITGTTSYSQADSIETVHLQYDMSNCRISSTSSSSDLNVDLTLSGVISEEGSWSSATDYVSLSYNSLALHVDGLSQRGSRQREVNDTTAFKANRTSSGTSAELFGFKVSW
jgi:hypothetical protein